eukprot:TRINITY_DN17846_c0_g1_i1.p1 TRINITY_DN17846_c0_g1~~TRINITY_DN17846_c0_g1_i1.p1  ORF type:complete len:149 (-),score=32.04 TRINITY_DN17846_c0_g1_i1:87-533(-)
MHDMEEIIWKTKTIKDEEKQIISEEKTATDDSATKLEQEDAELVGSILLSQKQEKHIYEQQKTEQDEIEEAIWETEITANTKSKTDQSNIQLQAEDLKQIEKEGINSDRQKQLEHQDIEGIMWETKITTQNKNHLKSKEEIIFLPNLN